ncbi:hypothetical protein [Endobacterium cereale]|uniref:hypothetical protein n=1 Tax=Endobacterium cereale TaxID=2663029 RepID=UPI001F3E0D9B|nr:hypothetical protein [Endobacterium cereale]MEB2847407.1 hypothetical protein [Endobacterium cereale]
MGKALQHNIDYAVSGVRFTVGRDENGCWIVDDREGLVGGIFRDRASAVHFAMFESDHQPGAVCCVPDGMIVSARMPDTAPGSRQSNQAVFAAPRRQMGFRVV